METSVIKDILAFDSEGYSFLRGRKIGDPIGFQFKLNDEKSIILDLEDGFDYFTDKLVNTEVTFMGVNIAYDLMAYLRAGEMLGVSVNQTAKLVLDGLWDGRFIDLSLCEGLTALGTIGYVPNMGARSLAALEKKYLGIDRSADKQGDVWRLKYGQLAETNLEFWPEEAIAYALADVDNIKNIYYIMTEKEIWPRIGGKRYPLVSNREVTNAAFQTMKAFCLYYISSQGVNIDKDYVKAREKELLEEFIKLSKDCFKAGLLSFKDKKIKLPLDENQAFAFASDILDKHYKEAFSYVFDMDEDDEDDEGDEDEDQENRLIVSYGKLSPVKRNMTIIRQLVASAYMASNMIPPMTDTGKNISTSKDAINGCPFIKEGHPLHSMLKRGKIEKQLSTYIKGMRIAAELGVPATPDFNPLLNTGRTSTFGLFPVQVIPKKGNIRPCVKADPDHIIVEVDLSAQEVRSLLEAMVQLGIKCSMAEKFKKDIYYDPHTDFARYMMEYDGHNLTYEEAIKIKNDDKHPLHDLLLERRQQAKVANFGFPGGMGGATLIAYAKGYGLTLTIHDALHLREMWLGFEPGFADYLEMISKLTSTDTLFSKKKKELVNCGTVRQLFTGRIRAKVPYTGAANTYFQGFAADAAAIATFFVVRGALVGDIFPGLYRSRVWHHIHDAWGVECKKANVQFVAKDLKAAILHGVQMIHENVPCDAEPTICERWQKNKTTLNAEGDYVYDSVS